MRQSCHCQMGGRLGTVNANVSALIWIQSKGSPIHSHIHIHITFTTHYSQFTMQYSVSPYYSPFTVTFAGKQSRLISVWVALDLWFSGASVLLFWLGTASKGGSLISFWFAYEADRDNKNNNRPISDPRLCCKTNSWAMPKLLHLCRALQSSSSSSWSSWSSWSSSWTTWTSSEDHPHQFTARSLRARSCCESVLRLRFSLSFRLGFARCQNQSSRHSWHKTMRNSSRACAQQFIKGPWPVPVPKASLLLSLLLLRSLICRPGCGPLKCQALCGAAVQSFMTIACPNCWLVMANS